MQLRKLCISTCMACGLATAFLALAGRHEEALVPGLIFLLFAVELLESDRSSRRTK